MNKRRLLKLADLLEADANNPKGIKFDLATWGETKDDSPQATVSCNTTACAIGLACVSGAFRRQGLSYRIEDEGIIIPVAYTDEAELDELDAVGFIFGISFEEAKLLFVDDKYEREKRTGAVGERAVAQRIRDFVAGKVAP